MDDSFEMAGGTSPLEAALSSLDTRLQKEVNEMVELVRLVDPDIANEELELLKHNFSTYKLFIKDGTHYALEGVTDTVEIQLKIEKAKTDLVYMCYNFIRSYYTKANNGRVVLLLDSFKRVQSRLATRRELGIKEQIRETRREATAINEDEEEDGEAEGSSNDEDVRDLPEEHQNGDTHSLNSEPTTDSSSKETKTPLLSSTTKRKNKKNYTYDSVASTKPNAEEDESTFYQSEYFQPPTDKETRIEQLKKKYIKYRGHFTKKAALEVITNKLPILRWFPLFYLPWLLTNTATSKEKRSGPSIQATDKGWRYILDNFRCDILAAVTVGFMLIPQGMSYALVAELPPIYGLYSALVPLAVYTFFGSSAELSVGPVAMVSLLIPEAASRIAEKGTQEYVEAAILVSAISGILLICGSLLHVGFILENLLSHPVLSGFTSGAAIIIMCSQLKHLFRIDMKGNTLIEYLESFFSNITEIHLWTTLFALLCIGFIFVVRRIQRRLPGALILLLLTTFLSWVLDLSDKLNLNQVGELPDGLPSPSWINALSWDNIVSVLPAAATISLLGFIESISVAKQFAAKKQYRISVGQELFALGMSNVTGALFQSFPVTGSLSRSAVNYQAGSRTPLSSLLASGLIAITLLFLTPAFKYTPLFVLASIVVSAAVLLIDYEEVQFLIKIGDKVDLCQAIIVFLITLLLGPELGVIGAIAVSLLQLIYKSAKPNFPRLGRLPGTLVYRDVKRFPAALRYDGILVVRFDSDLFFANVNWFRERLTVYEAKSKHKLHAIILDATGINSLDSTSIHLLEELGQDFTTKKIRFLWANVKGSVRDTLKTSGLSAKLGVDNFFLTTHDAVHFILSDLEDRGLLKQNQKQVKRASSSSSLEDNGDEDDITFTDGSRLLNDGERKGLATPRGEDSASSIRVETISEGEDEQAAAAKATRGRGSEEEEVDLEAA